MKSMNRVEKGEWFKMAAKLMEYQVTRSQADLVHSSADNVVYMIF